MQGNYLYKKLGKYPGMCPEDVVIWERFLEKCPDYYNSVDYNVRVGDGQKSLPGLPPEIERDQKMLTQKRIDVVGYNFGQIDIIEVKPKAGATAIGQVEMYEHLFKESFKPKEEIYKKILTDILIPDIDKYCKSKKIEIIVV